VEPVALTTLASTPRRKPSPPHLRPLAALAPIPILPTYPGPLPIYLISAHKKGISSVQLAKDLGVTQKTAWFMLHRIRESLKVNGVHTNTVENFWSVMKRGVYGIYHQINYKHLQAYYNEYSYRYNARK
jgi:hypothetical protein